EAERIERIRRELINKKESVESDTEDDGDGEGETTEDDKQLPGPAGEEVHDPERWTPERSVSIYEKFAEQSGELDYETYWERRFEHNCTDHSYRRASFEFGKALRELEEDRPRWRAENLVREAYMRRRIEEVLAKGIKPEKIVAVVGAFHAPVLTGEFPA